jgi:poly(3-hydroxybutyrate) depolymerase
MSKKIPSVSSLRSHALLALCFAFGLGCSNDTSGTGGSSSSASTGSPGSGGSSASGSASSASSGGQGGSSSASESVGGGGSSSKAGSTASGGKSTVGGSSIDTSSASGGKGGSEAGTTVGGSSVTGGSVTTGGTSKTGGSTGTGGTAKTGGSATGGGATGGTGAGGTGGSTSTGAPGGAKASDGCGKDPPTLKSAAVGQATPVNTISGSRQFLVRWPTNYDNKKPYPLHIGLHGANGDLAENGKDNFGLWSLAKDTVIFVTLAGVNKLWDGPRDVTYADEVLKQVESELCIDTSRIFLEGFSMGAAMSWYITGSRPGVYRGVVGHSGGGVGNTPALSPVAYLGSLGTGESGNSQKTQTDQFAKANGCTIDTLPTATTGKHVCTPYKGCKEGFPTTWCSFDGGHGFTPKDSGASTTWVPAAVWDFLKPLL